MNKDSKHKTIQTDTQSETRNFEWRRCWSSPIDSNPMNFWINFLVSKADILCFACAQSDVRYWTMNSYRILDQTENKRCRQVNFYVCNLCFFCIFIIPMITSCKHASSPSALLLRWFWTNRYNSSKEKQSKLMYRAIHDIMIQIIIDRAFLRYGDIFKFFKSLDNCRVHSPASIRHKITSKPYHNGPEPAQSSLSDSNTFCGDSKSLNIWSEEIRALRAFCPHSSAWYIIYLGTNSELKHTDSAMVPIHYISTLTHVGCSTHCFRFQWQWNYLDL